MNDDNILYYIQDDKFTYGYVTSESVSPDLSITWQPMNDDKKPPNLRRPQKGYCEDCLYYVWNTAHTGACKKYDDYIVDNNECCDDYE